MNVKMPQINVLFVQAISLSIKILNVLRIVSAPWIPLIVVYKLIMINKPNIVFALIQNFSLI